MRWPLKETLRQPCYLGVLAFLAPPLATLGPRGSGIDYNGEVIRQHQTWGTQSTRKLGAKGRERGD
jgi:hypothetical protein